MLFIANPTIIPEMKRDKVVDSRIASFCKTQSKRATAGAKILKYK